MGVTTAKTTTFGLFKALELIAKGRVDATSIQAVTGGAVATTHAEVGRFLGVAANTIKQSWAPEGMPGEQGSYPIAEIVAWRLRYLAELEGRKQTAAELTNSQLEREQAEEELRKIKLQNDKLEMEVGLAQGKLIDRAAVLEAWKTDNSVLVERIKKLPRMKWATLLSQDQAAQMVPVYEDDLDREFIAHSEGRLSDVISAEEDEIDT